MTVYLAGLFDHHRNESNYYIHTHVTESANTIISIIHYRLSQIFQESQHRPTDLTLIMDNKKTGKNYLLICYLEYVVLHLKWLKMFRVIFLLKGMFQSIKKEIILMENNISCEKRRRIY